MKWEDEASEMFKLLFPNEIVRKSKKALEFWEDCESCALAENLKAVSIQSVIYVIRGRL